MVGHVEEAMHVIWHMLAYVIESLLFLMTGGFLGAFIVEDTQQFIDLRSRFHNDLYWKMIVF